MLKKISKKDLTEWIRGFIDRFYIVRKKAGLSTTELSALVGRAGHATVARFERGEAKGIGLPLLGLLVWLMRDSGFSAEWLFTGRGPMFEADGGVPLFRAGARQLIDRVGEATSAGPGPKGRAEMAELTEFLRKAGELRDEIAGAEKSKLAMLRQAALAEIRALRKTLLGIERIESPRRSRRTGKTKKKS